MSEPIEMLGEFLSRGESYGLPGVAVSRISTHCSEVFLVGNQAYKLKQPIAFSSLDYRTLDRREMACRAELELNRRTAPELYLGVHAVRRRGDGTLRLDGEGELIDWLVAMRRFDQRDLFDHLAAAGRLTPALMALLATEIVHLHVGAEITPHYGGAAYLRHAVERNHHDLLTVSALLGSDKIDRLRADTLDRIAALHGRLDKRRAENRVRRVHGDLRLANICLLDGRPTLFDAVEFNETLSCIDLLYDLAFLLIDLHHGGQDLLANVVFNQYLDAMPGEDDLGLLPLMMSIRAATRAYALAGSSQRRTDRSEIARFAASAKSMLERASALLRKTRPQLVAIGGFGGSRKNDIIARIAAEMPPAPGARIIRSGAARRRVTGIAAADRLKPTAYGADINDSVYDNLFRQAEVVLAAGHSAIIDASFFYPHHRRAIQALADRAGLPLAGLWLGSATDMLQAVGETGNEWPAIGLDEPTLALAAARRSVRVLASR